LLLEKGADIKATSAYSVSVLCTVLIICTAKDGWTPLHVSAQNGHTDLVKLLLEKGAEVNRTGAYSACLPCTVSIIHTDEDGWTPLHVAAQNGHTVLVMLLLEKGAEVNGTGTYSNFPPCTVIFCLFSLHCVDHLHSKGRANTPACCCTERPH
jgi:ankyrin repeat protein